MNVKELLKPGGMFCCIMLKSHVIFNTYLRLSGMEEFRDYMQDVNSFIPPTFAHANSESIREALKSLNLRVEVLKSEEREFDYATAEEYSNAMKSVNPFINRMPTKVKHNFMENIVHYLQNFNKQRDEESEFSAPYELITIIATRL